MRISRIALVLFSATLAFPAFAQGVTYKYQEKNGTTGIQNLVPSGTWWRDSKYVALLSLTMDQQRRMDDVFQQRRIPLIDIKATLDREEAILDPMLKADRLDEVMVAAQIDKVANARAELEKANAKMLLGIRQVLTAEQWTMLNSSKLGGYYKGGSSIYKFKDVPAVKLKQ
jgi:Spy/CpxP family protein refolding chaperone